MEQIKFGGLTLFHTELFLNPFLSLFQSFSFSPSLNHWLSSFSKRFLDVKGSPKLCGKGKGRGGVFLLGKGVELDQIADSRFDVRAQAESLLRGSPDSNTVDHSKRTSK